MAARPAHAGTRPTNALRFYCEGLEEKFLERGAPAPLSVRLIDTTSASAKVWYSPSAAQKPALMKPCSSMPNLLRPFRGAPVHFCSGVLRTPSVFPQHGCSKTVLQMRANNTRRSQTAATALQMSVAAAVRARNNSELISGMKHKYLSAPSTLPPQRKTTKYPIALFNPPSHDGGYHNGLKSQVCTNNPGAQWTARPTDSLRLWCEGLK